MDTVRRASPQILRRTPEDAPDYQWSRYHDGKVLCHSASGALYIVDPRSPACSCPEWHRRGQYEPEGLCFHLRLLGQRLLDEGRQLVALGLSLGGDEVEP